MEPLPVAERPWESISMDFITSLPKSNGFGTIMVVVDRFSKYATFIPATAGCTAKEAALLFFKNVVKYWGLPRYIISDQDPRLTGTFGMNSSKLLIQDFTSPQVSTRKLMARLNASTPC